MTPDLHQRLTSRRATKETSMKLTLQTFLTLDGVLQAPGGPNEDTDAGFPYGGWGVPFGDEEVGAALTTWVEGAEGVLLRRCRHDVVRERRGVPSRSPDLRDLCRLLAEGDRPGQPDCIEAQCPSEVR